MNLFPILISILGSPNRLAYSLLALNETSRLIQLRRLNLPQRLRARFPPMTPQLNSQVSDYSLISIRFLIILRNQVAFYYLSLTFETMERSRRISD